MSTAAPTTSPTRPGPAAATAAAADLPTHPIPGDVDPGTGHIDFKGNVNIRGSVRDLFKVAASGHIIVGGAVEAAEIRAGGDLRVAGVIAGRDRGTCVAGGSIQARHISNANLEAARDILCQSEIVSSRLIAGGKVTVSDGAIVAGHIIANGGVRCRVLGSSAQVAMLIEVGIDEALRRTVPDLIKQIEARRARATKIEQALLPLMQNQKNLPPSLKEKATELLFEAQEAGSEADNLIRTLRQRHADAIAQACAQIMVADVLHAGVEVRFPGQSAKITSTFKGPLTIQLRRYGNDTRVVVADSAGCEQPLITHPVADTVAIAMARIAA